MLVLKPDVKSSFSPSAIAALSLACFEGGWCIVQRARHLHYTLSLACFEVAQLDDKHDLTLSLACFEVRVVCPLPPKERALSLACFEGKHYADRLVIADNS